jgi:SpoVK/Ycf46/Vps4 family AAA+-type ATPase
LHGPAFIAARTRAPFARPLAATPAGMDDPWHDHCRYALCSDAWMLALRAKIASVRAELRAAGALDDAAGEAEAEVLVRRAVERLSDTDATVVVSAEHFVAARAQLRPSVSDEDLAYYRSVQAQFAQSF